MQKPTALSCWREAPGAQLIGATLAGCTFCSVALPVALSTAAMVTQVATPSSSPAADQAVAYLQRGRLEGGGIGSLCMSAVAGGTDLEARAQQASVMLQQHVAQCTSANAATLVLHKSNHARSMHGRELTA